MDTKTALLDSAERLARARGYDGFSYADLADEVGIRKASIHYHFPAKSDLALAVMQRYRRNVSQHLVNIEENNEAAGAKLRAFIAMYQEALSNCTTLCLCVAFSNGRHNLSEPVLAEINSFHTAARQWLENVFADAQRDGSVASVQSPADEAAACLALVEGAQILARASTQMEDFERALARFISRLA